MDITLSVASIVGGFIGLALGIYIVLKIGG